jgi:hypothetical protein
LEESHSGRPLDVLRVGPYEITTVKLRLAP